MNNRGTEVERKMEHIGKEADLESVSQQEGSKRQIHLPKVDRQGSNTRECDPTFSPDTHSNTLIYSTSVLLTFQDIMSEGQRVRE